jgi:hypothetical protein
MSRSILAVVLLVFLSIAQAREIVVALSPFQTPEQAKAQAVQVLEFLTKLEPGDRAVLVDGERIATICEFQIPADPAYSAPKARLAVNRAAVNSITAFAKRATAPTADEARRVPGALRLPQVLEFAAITLAAKPGTDILVLGSPIYDAPGGDAAFSMAADRVPSDGHLQASRSDTVYGTQDRPEALRGLRVHLAYEATPSLRTDQYRHAVQRFWTLYVEQLGGSLVTFTEDLPSVFRRVNSSAQAPAHEFKREDSRRIEMIRFNPPRAGMTIHERPLSVQPLAPSDVQNAESLEVGLSWNCAACDLDLYAMAHHGIQPLYFGRMDTPQGRYFKDFRRSPQSTGGFETIAFTVPVDLREATIAVNFFGGKAPAGIRAELRVSVNGQTFAGAIDFAPGDGNAAADVGDVLARERASAHTRLIDVLAIVNPKP